MAGVAYLAGVAATTHAPSFLSLYDNHFSRPSTLMRLTHLSPFIVAASAQGVPFAVSSLANVDDARWITIRPTSTFCGASPNSTSPDAEEGRGALSSAAMNSTLDLLSRRCMVEVGVGSGRWVVAWIVRAVVAAVAAGGPHGGEICISCSTCVPTTESGVGSVRLGTAAGSSGDEPPLKSNIAVMLYSIKY